MAAIPVLVSKKALAMKCRHSTSFAVLGLFLAFPVMAQQALVRSFKNVALEIGQSYLSHYGERCLAVMPTHVADEAGDVAAFLREGRSPLLGESAHISDLGDDVSVADIVGGIRGSCGYSTVAVSRDVASRIKANAIAIIRSVNSDGSIAQLSVTIIDDDGRMFLRIQPTNDFNQFRKGQSGSMLMSGDTPIGMLLSVDARFGFGKVIRFDAMFDKIDEFVRGGDMPVRRPSPAGEPAWQLGSADHDGNSETITSWSALPVDADHRAANLVAINDAPAWVAGVAHWPVEIEMDLSGDRIAIAGVELDGSGIADPGTLPAIVELMVSSTESGRRWRSVAGGEIRFIDGSATISIAPIWARQIKLVISAAANGADTLALRRLRIIPAD